MILRPPISTLFPYTTLFRSFDLFLLLGHFHFAQRERRARGVARLAAPALERSEEHTSELQSRPHLVCRLLLEKKKIIGADAESVLSSRVMWYFADSC